MLRTRPDGDADLDHDREEHTSRNDVVCARSRKTGVRKGGLEPPRVLPHQILNLARLPIPPLSLRRANIPFDRVISACIIGLQNEMKTLKMIKNSLRSLFSLRVIVLLLLGSQLVRCSSTTRTTEQTQRPVMAENVIRETPPSITESIVVPEPQPVNDDEIVVGRFDGGKMWTFDNPPVAYFEETYGFTPDKAWFDKARLGALRFSSYCSASFVSATGLIMTNHHCARESVTEVSQEGEKLLDNGFYAESASDERKVEDLYVDQLISLEDVTAEVYAAIKKVKGAGPQAEARRNRAEKIEKRLQTQASAADSSLQVEIVALYYGGKYAAYTYKRYDDIRLVMVPELQIGFFGGDHDNFTYPRYNLDMSFFRAYGENDEPLDTPDYFKWDMDGASDGDAVFVVGNPGQTSRMSTVSQLEYFRDYSLPEDIRVLEKRGQILAAYIESYPEEADEFDIRNDYFSIQNSLKNQKGQLEGLLDGALIARREAAENILREEIEKSDSLSTIYGSVLKDIERLQASKRASAEKAAVFTQFMNPALSSRILTRAMYGYFYSIMRQRGAPQETLDDLREEAASIKSWPDRLEREVIAQRVSEFVEYLGPTDPSARKLQEFGGAEALADSIVAHSVLSDSASFMALLDQNYLGSGDNTVDVINTIAPLYFTLNQQLSAFVDQENSFAARLARAQFAIYSDTFPPDASFSPRIADGVISGYEYNGTLAPAFTNFYGMFELTYAHAGKKQWELPERWKNPGSGFNYSTPLNLVSTNDITGGNSGSPLLNIALEVVGLVFDGNIESLPNQFLYTDVGARTVSVDVRGILESLDKIYGAKRIVDELTH